MATVNGVFPTREADRRFAAIISSAQRLPNGNTLLDYGSLGHFVEATPDGTIVWEYENPRYTVRRKNPDPDGRRLRDRAVVDLPHPPLRARLSRTGRARELTARAPAQRSRRSASPATVTISSATSPSARWTGSGTRPRVPATGNTVAITPVSTCSQCAPALRSTARIARFS